MSATEVDDYIAEFPADIRPVLVKVREAIRKAAPDAEETIKYRLPTFVLSGKNLVHFGGFTKHIGFYPTPSGITAFHNQLKRYKSSKGSVQFPLDESIPYALITRIVKFRVKEVATSLEKTK